jgi:hypothetical protein
MGAAPQLNRAAANGLHRTQSAFAKMDSRDIAIVVDPRSKARGSEISSKVVFILKTAVKLVPIMNQLAKLRFIGY